MLKDHYLASDWQQVLDELETLTNTSCSLVKMTKNAEFSSKNEQLAKINRSLEIIQALHRKKIDRELNYQAVEILNRGVKP